MMLNLQQTTISKDRLEQEIAERRKAEIALLEAQNKLKQHAGNLEKMVQERTKAIRESERNYKELYESFGEAFIATDWEFNVIHWNKAAEKVTEIKAKDALGKKIYDVLPEMLSVDITPYFKDLQEKKIVRFMMNTVSRETKKPSIFEISIYPSTLGMIVIVEDKTDEERNRRLSAIGQTASMVGHDIRNPLQSITSSLYLIKEEMKESPECQNNPDLQDSFVMIEENVEYINKIVSDLQDYTRPLTPVKKEVKLLGFLKSILATVKIPESIVSEIIAIEDLVIITDASYLKRALVNLVTNAVQAMPNGGELTISAIGREDNVLISVKDTGTGISKEAQEKIFTPLFTTKSKGQGLGLAVVKRIVDALKGNITYKSEEGKGTEFIIEIPKR
jgi:PAS domain S-box-containing protein